MHDPMLVGWMAAVRVGLAQRSEVESVLAAIADPLKTVAELAHRIEGGDRPRRGAAVAELIEVTKVSSLELIDYAVAAAKRGVVRLAAEDGWTPEQSRTVEALVADALQQFDRRIEALASAG